MKADETLTAVNLLTGFLGSGKTTLLQQLLGDPAMADVAVLINELGEVGLDHHLLERIDDNIVLLNSGCLCCTVRGELADALLDLYTKRSAGDISWFDRIVIESTGLADPFPALSTLQAHAVLKNHFIIASVVTTIDAVNGETQLAGRMEAVRQAAAADVLVITKTDLADEVATARLHRLLARLNPAARVIEAGQAKASDFLASASALNEGESMHEALHAADAFARSGDGLHHHHHHHHHDDHADAHEHDEFDVQSFSLVIEEQLDWTAFGMWLTMLLHRHGDKIFRVKGILNVAGEAYPVAVHGVQRLVHPPVHMHEWPDSSRASRLVFIVEGIDPALIRSSFQAFNDLSAKVL